MTKKTTPKVRGKPPKGPPRQRAVHKPVARGVMASDNRKTGQVNVTYVSQGSCPETCPHKDNGCYAELGPVGRITSRLNAGGCGLTPDEYAEAEAAELDAMRPDRDVRLHVVGDCRTESAARTVAAAATRYVTRSAAILLDPPSVWTYTHAWRLVPRDAWGSVSVLASCENAGDVHAAHARGYAAALVVAEYEDDKAYDSGEGFTLVPCVYQTRGVQCVDCRLCFDDRALWESNRVIAFKAHGARRKSVLRTLEVLP